jgi:hypothetical protein
MLIFLCESEIQDGWSDFSPSEIQDGWSDFSNQLCLNHVSMMVAIWDFQLKKQQIFNS